MKVYPRFSIRTLAISVTLIGCYLACWSPTKNAAESKEPNIVRRGSTSIYFKHARPLIPLVLTQYECVVDHTTRTLSYRRSYYLWLFGPRIRFPTESEWKDKDMRFFTELERAIIEQDRLALERSMEDSRRNRHRVRYVLSEAVIIPAAR